MVFRIKISILVLVCLFVQSVFAQAQARKWGFIRPDGSTAIPAIFDGADSFSEDLAMVRIGQKWGYIDRTGQQVIPFHYAQAQPFKDGVASVRLPSQSEWILINKQGERLGNKSFASSLFFYEGLAEFREGTKTGYVDLNGNVAIEPGDFLGGPFGDGLAAITLKKGYAFIDRTGKIALPGPYEQTDGFRSGYARIKVRNNEALIDTKGKYFLPPKYYAVSEFTEGLLGVKTTRTAAGFMDASGKMVIQPKWHFAMPFANGYSIVVVNNKYGSIDKSGKVVIPIEYDSLEQRGPGIFRAVKGQKLQILNAKAEAFSSEEISFISIVSEGLIGYSNTSKKFGFLSGADGSIAIPPTFCSGGVFRGSLAPVQFCD